jgi:predicted AlkP superfamily phosphohydrolase/phosphomutase
MKLFKVFVLGLDGATLDLIHPWVSEGKLPTLAKLLSTGAYGQLRSTMPPMTGPAWTTFATGKNPGRHGIYDWVYRHADSYDVSPTTAHHSQATSLWSLLSRAGKRVCVINVPMTYPPQPVNGVMISGLPAPSKKVTIAYPGHLLEEIEREMGREYILYPDPGQAYSDAGIDAFLKRLYATTDTRLVVLNRLRQREDWDFTMVVFNGTDTVQHAMWKFMDPHHPQYNSSKAVKYGDAIQKYFSYLDGRLAEVVNSLDEDTVLMVMSDHGFGPFHKFIHVNNWLMQRGYLTLKPNVTSRIKGLMFRAGFSPMKVYNMLMRVGLGRLKREVVRGSGQGMLKALFLSFDDVDWSRTRAYSLGNIGQIYLNVKGREPNGCVEPGEAYEQLRHELIAELEELRDPATGEQVVEHIYKREQVYSGPNVQRGADILFIPTRMEYFGFGEYEFGASEVIEPVVRGISGTHRMNGTLMLYGSPVLPGQKLGYDQLEPIEPDRNTAEGRIPQPALTDLAPTILYLMGVPVPDDMDGRVLAEALKPEYADLHRLVRERASDVEPSDEASLSDEDEAMITERLRALGYVS